MKARPERQVTRYNLRSLSRPLDEFKRGRCLRGVATCGPAFVDDTSGMRFVSAIVAHSVRYITLLLDLLLVESRWPHNSRMKVPHFLTTWPNMVVAHLEVWPETRFSPSRRFLNVDYRYNSG